MKNVEVLVSNVTILNGMALHIMLRFIATVYTHFYFKIYSTSLSVLSSSSSYLLS